MEDYSSMIYRMIPACGMYYLEFPRSCYSHQYNTEATYVSSRQWDFIASRTEPFALSLSNTNIRNNDLKHLLDLSNLRYLALNNCPWLSGNVADILAEMESLEGLEFDSVNMSGDDFQKLSRLPRLRSLVLGTNGRLFKKGKADSSLALLADFPSLEDLRLFHLPITGKSFSVLAELPNLSTLLLNDCQNLTAAGFRHLGKLKRLERLLLNNCPLENDALLFLNDIDSLRFLYLEYLFEKKMKDNDLAPLAHHTQLRELILRCPAITDMGLEAIANLHHLEYLDFSSTSTGNRNLAPLAELKELKELNLGAGVTDDGLAVFAGHGKLETLSLFFCNKLTPNGFRSLAELPRLRKITLPYQFPVKTILPILKSLPSLEELDFNLCQTSSITDADLALTGEMFHLKELNLSGCDQITDVGLLSLQNLTSLEKIRLCHCKQLTIAGLQYLLPLTNLKYIYLPEQLKTDEAATVLTGFPNLDGLNFDDSSTLTDRGLAYLANLPRLKGLSLSNCPQITGDGLAVLSSLPQLERLDLSECKRVGNESVPFLRQLHSPEFICLNNTRISRRNISELRRHFPDCDIPTPSPVIPGKLVAGFFLLMIILSFVSFYFEVGAFIFFGFLFNILFMGLVLLLNFYLFEKTVGAFSTVSF